MSKWIKIMLPYSSEKTLLILDSFGGDFSVKGAGGWAEGDSLKPFKMLHQL